MIDKFNSSMYVYESNSAVIVGAAAGVSVNIPGDTDQEHDEFLLNLVDMF